MCQLHLLPARGRGYFGLVKSDCLVRVGQHEPAVGLPPARSDAIAREGHVGGISGKGIVLTSARSPYLVHPARAFVARGRYSGASMGMEANSGREEVRANQDQRGERT